MRQAEARWRQNIFRKLSERLLCLPERLMLNTTRHKQFLITKECAIVWLDALVAFPWTAISSSANICLAVCKLALRISICSSFATANYLITRPAFTRNPIRFQLNIQHVSPSLRCSLGPMMLNIFLTPNNYGFWGNVCTKFRFVLRCIIRFLALFSFAL